MQNETSRKRIGVIVCVAIVLVLAALLIFAISGENQPLPQVGMQEQSSTLEEDDELPIIGPANEGDASLSGDSADNAGMSDESHNGDSPQSAPRQDESSDETEFDLTGGSESADGEGYETEIVPAL